MARLPRLAAAGHPHLVYQRTVHGQSAFKDDDDRHRFLHIATEASRQTGTVVHAYALLDEEVFLLATPAHADSLSRFMQSMGRRYNASFNRRHGRQGALWAGRFRAGILEHSRVLDAMWLIDSRVEDGGDGARSSGAHHLGGARSALVVEHPAYWALGNTPFDREAAYRGLLLTGLSASVEAALLDAAKHGRTVASAAFVAVLEAQLDRSLTPARRGRPRKESASSSK